MMKLSHEDMMDSMEDCKFEATGDTATDVAKKMMMHVKSSHPETVKGMSDEQIMKMFEMKVHS